MEDTEPIMGEARPDFTVLGRATDGVVVIELGGETLFVPDTPGGYYQDLIAEWEAAGNVMPDYEPEPPG